MTPPGDVSHIDVAPPFETFFEAGYPRLVRLMYAMTLDLPEAEELAQEAMLRVYERWEEVGRMESPDGYVYRTALNLQRKRLRHLGVRARRLLHLRSVAPMEPHVPAEILTSLASLPGGQRAALLLVEWLGMTAEEAGEVLAIAPASVRSRVHRAKATLRDTLEEVDHA